jgi:YVTN family beta-propeller protein
VEPPEAGAAAPSEPFTMGCMRRRRALHRSLHVAVLLGPLAGCGAATNEKPTAEVLPQTLFVGHEGSLISYDVATGDERPGAVQSVISPAGLQALENGTLLVNLTDPSEVLIVDGKTMVETSRIPSSRGKATRPVGSYVTPDHGKRYWISLNDGDEEQRDIETNSAVFVDIDPDSTTYLEMVGEVPLGIGHHEATFSATQDRVVISNGTDCDNVLGVYDYSDISDIRRLATISAVDAGFDGSSYATTCDPKYREGMPPVSNGCATAKATGMAYCNFANSGRIVAIDIDASPPTFEVLTTNGTGSGYTKAHPEGRYVYSVQETPREFIAFRPPGPTCQIGQLVVIDAEQGRITEEIPLGYEGPSCSDVLIGTDKETAKPGHMQFSGDGATLYVMVEGGHAVMSARVRRAIVLDLSNPARPVQRASLETGPSAEQVGDCLSAEGTSLFIANNRDGSVTLIDANGRAVAGKVKVSGAPLTIATFGDAEGPSVHAGPIH